MAVKHILRKIFSNFKGLDKRSSHITRSPEHAVEAKNVRYRSSGAISKRKGSHISHGEFKGGYGLVTFKKIDTTSGAVSDELISVAADGKLYRSLESDISITVDSATVDWQGAKANTTNDNLTTQYYVSNKVNPSTKEFIFTINRENVEILSYNLGTGLAVSDSSVTNLLNAINNATINEGICSNASYTSSDFCTANGGTWTEPDANLTAAATNSAILSKKAAFIDTLNNQEIMYGTPLVLKYRTWEEIPMGDTTFQSGKAFGNLGRDTEGNTSDVDFENASFAQINNVLYICSGIGNPIMKYDGSKVYRAGLPAPTNAPTLTTTALSTSSNPNAANEKCISFTSDTTNHFFDMGGVSDFDNSGDNFFFRRRSDRFTISFWANFDALNSSNNASDEEHIFSVGDEASKGFRVYSRNNQISISFGAPTSIENYGTLNFGNEAWGDGDWHHYVITYDGPGFVASSGAAPGDWSGLEDHLKLYKDSERVYANSYDHVGYPWYVDWEILGIGDCSDTQYENQTLCENNGGTWTPTGRLRLGFPNYSYNNHTNLKGKYDEIAIWKSVLATSQIETIYNDGSPNDVSIINSSDLKRYYKFEGSSPYDDSAGNFNGTAGASASNTTMTSADSIFTPIPTAIGLDSATDDNFYFYKYTYEYTDELGNLISSEPSPSAKINIPTNQTHGVSVEYDNLQLGTGFNLAGSSNGKIRIKIYRTKSTATETTEPSEIYYLVNSFALPYRATITSSLDFVNYRALPAYGGHEIHNEAIENDTTTATSFYIDFLEDGGKSSQNTTFFTNELITYKVHAKRQDLPPNGKYICGFQDCLIIGGQKEVNTISYSLPFNTHSMEIGSEYFPNDDNQEIIDSYYGDKITAIAALKDTLYIFHKNSIHTLTGSITDISGIAYQTDLLTAEGGIGCEAQSSIQELSGNLFFLSKNGIYSINSSEGFPKELSLPIQPEFKEAITNFNRHKAISFNWVKENSLIFLLPVETLDDGAGTTFKRLTTTNDSKIFVYDYSRHAWLEWSNLDFSGGIAEFNDVVYFNTRSLDLSNDYISYTYKFQDNGNTFDYADGTEPISFKYKTSWEALEEPTVFKKFLRIKSYAFDADDSFESPTYILNANIEKNYINQSTGIVPLDFGEGSGGGWGGAPWSTSPWGSRVLDSIKSKLPTGKAKSIAISFENNTINENVLLSGYELEIAGPYRKEIKE